MSKLFICSLLLLSSCSTTFQIQNKIVSATTPDLQVTTFTKGSKSSNESLIDALVTAPNLFVSYVEDGAADGSVLSIYEDGLGNMTNTIAKEVQDIVALREKAIPLLIEHLDDTRPTSATTSGGGYLTDKPINVPVGHICLDILIQIIGIDNRLIYNEEERGGFGSEINDGYYFRPDDYRVIDKMFIERPIVRIVKKNWQKAYRDGKIKFNYVIPWK